MHAHSRQSARLFLPSSELGPPTPSPHPQSSVSPPFGSRWDTFACGWGGGGPSSDEGTGDRHCGTLGTLHGVQPLCIVDNTVLYIVYVRTQVVNSFERFPYLGDTSSFYTADKPRSPVLCLSLHYVYPWSGVERYNGIGWKISPLIHWPSPQHTDIQCQQRIIKLW